MVAADTGQPLRKAQVRINSTGPFAAGQPPENRLAITDNEGRYDFKQQRAGRYNVGAQKGSFVGLQWGQLRPNQPGKPIDILDGQALEKLDFALPRGGVVTGRILDELSEPVTDVQVTAMRLQNVSGTPRLVNAGRAAMTNDIGEFRLFALQPGDYYISAIFRNLNPGAESDDRTGYAPTYYPGAPDVSTAQKLTVAAGQTINDLVLSLLPTRTARVSGRAVNSQGRPIRGLVQAIRHRGTDVTDSGIDVRPNEELTDIEVEITNRVTDVSGLVTNGRGEPVKDYWAVIFARDREKWQPPSRYVRISRPDQDGCFKVTGLPPGDYLVVAGDTFDPSEATDPEFLDRLQRSATRLSLGEGETKTLDLKLSSAP